MFCNPSAYEDAFRWRRNPGKWRRIESAVIRTVSELNAREWLLGDHQGLLYALVLSSSNGIVTGLEPGQTGGWHVHSGFTCDDAAKVGGHYFEAGSDDPWTLSNSFYVADTNGVATISHSEPGFTLHDDMAVAGRTVVFHLGTDSAVKIGCGVITPTKAQLVSLGDYPGYAGGREVRGLLAVEDAEDGLRTHGTIVGLEPSLTGGWHIHSGYSCSETPAGLTDGAVGGHYYDGLTADPWTLSNTNYNSDESGVARISKTMPDFSLYGERPVYGRTVVVHESDSAVKPACGVIGVGAASYEAVMPSMVKYVDYTPGLTVNGMLKFSSVGSTLTVSGVLTGLEPSTSGGWHIHTGYSCTSASEIGLHYYTEGTPDVWLPMSYTADSTGAATIGAAIPGFDLTGRMPVLGRALVIHNSFGDRVGCGLITPRFNGAVAALSPYPVVFDRCARRLYSGEGGSLSIVPIVVVAQSAPPRGGERTKG